MDEKKTTEKFDPSPDWTEEDRRTTIGLIASVMRKEAQKGIVDGKKVYEWGDRISFLLTENAIFLESNRQNIIEGLPGSFERRIRPSS